MNLIFIRHGDPDYSIDSLTEKGWKEAELLSARTTQWDVKEFYCSPLGRAKDTAALTLNKLGRTAIIHDWLQEFYVPVKDPDNGNERIPWDLMPDYWTNVPELYHKDTWLSAPLMQTGEVSKKYEEVKQGIDAVLAEHGYERAGNYYKVLKGNHDTLVFFCHLGVQFIILSHLLGIPAPLLWQGAFVAPTSVTVLTTEERVEGNAYFRLRTLGDCAHLYVGKESYSSSGFFKECFNDDTNFKILSEIKSF